MNKQKVTKILLIVSFVIMIIGIISGILVSSEIKNSGMPSENVYIDGSDFTAISEAFVSIGSTIIGFLVSIYFAMMIVIIWVIYGIVILVIKIVNKIKEKKIK